ncbi:MAG: hypothetical protein R3D67_17595 [Hyphomicrobiaceae bacterium]
MNKTRDYKFTAFPGEALLFKTDSSLDEAMDGMFGWHDVLAVDTPVYHLSGWHEDALSGSDTGKIARIIEKRMLGSHAVMGASTVRSKSAGPEVGGQYPAA